MYTKSFVFSDQVLQGAAVTKTRTGQYLFNHLPQEVRSVVSGSYFDPFYKDLVPSEIEAWLDNHLIFDGFDIVAVFDGNKILWEKQ